MGWLRRLPWGNPAFGGLAMGMLTFGVGGAFAYALLSEGLATLLHNTFVVPGYFHAFTSAGVTVTFMGVVYALLPVLTGRRLFAAGVARLQPYLMAAGAILFLLFGVAAGYMGVPRRVPAVEYAGQAHASWAPLMNAAEGLGGLLMLAGGAAFFAVVAGTIIAGRPLTEQERVDATRIGGEELHPPAEPRISWVAGVPAILVVLLIMAVSIGSFEILRRGPFLIR